MIDSAFIAQLAESLPPDTAIVLLLPGSMATGEEEDYTEEHIFTGGMSPGGGGSAQVDGISQGSNTP